jgi:hypothetical protein
MSDETSADTGTTQGTFQAAKDAVGSAAEQVRAAAPGAYDAGAKAARYVGDTASEHPISVLLATAVLAYFAGYLSNAQTDSNSDAWQKRAYKMGDRARSAAPGVSEAASNAGEYVTRNVREYPLSGLFGAVAVGCVVGYLFQKRD